MDDLIEKLKSMGFNTYEAKVYLALLRHHPATGYEISKESGVPQARAYDTLKVLESAHQAVVSLGGKPVTYLPISPKELLDRWENSFNQSMSHLREALPNLSDETVEPIINLMGRESILNHALALIEKSEKNIFIELWQDDYNLFEEALNAAKKRGVAIKIVGYNNLNATGHDVFHHGLADNVEESLGGRWVIMQVDDTEGLVGSIYSDGDRPPHAVQTRNEAIVLVIKQLIIHDIFLLDIETNLHEEMIKLYGQDLNSIRRKLVGDTTVMHHFSFTK